MNNLTKVFKAYGEMMSLYATCYDSEIRKVYPEYPDDISKVCHYMLDIFRYLSGEDDELCETVDWDDFKMRCNYLKKYVHCYFDSVVDIVEKKMNGEW